MGTTKAFFSTKPSKPSSGPGQRVPKPHASAEWTRVARWRVPAAKAHDHQHEPMWMTPDWIRSAVIRQPLPGYHIFTGLFFYFFKSKLKKKRRQF